MTRVCWVLPQVSRKQQIACKHRGLCLPAVLFAGHFIPERPTHVLHKCVNSHVCVSHHKNVLKTTKQEQMRKSVAMMANIPGFRPQCRSVMRMQCLGACAESFICNAFLGISRISKDQSLLIFTQLPNWSLRYWLVQHQNILCEVQAQKDTLRQANDFHVGVLSIGKH